MTKYVLTQINPLLGSVSNEVLPENTAIIHELVSVLEKYRDMKSLEYSYLCNFSGHVTKVIVSKQSGSEHV